MHSTFLACKKMKTNQKKVKDKGRPVSATQAIAHWLLVDWGVSACHSTVLGPGLSLHLFVTRPEHASAFFLSSMLMNPSHTHQGENRVYTFLYKIRAFNWVWGSWKFKYSQWMYRSLKEEILSSTCSVCASSDCSRVKSQSNSNFLLVVTSSDVLDSSAAFS